MLILLTLIAAFWLPSVIAMARRHPSRWAVFWTNALFGITLVGWAVAFIWAFTTPHPKQPKVPT